MSAESVRCAFSVEPWGKGMLGTTLRFDHEVRDEKGFFKSIGSHRVPKEMVSLASHILDTKGRPLRSGQDEYELALRKLVKRKAAGNTIEAPEETDDRSNVIDLMEALRHSVKSEGRRAAAPSVSAGSKKASKPRSKQRKCKAA
jgi:non-homologous end joining protein Ku